MSLLSGLTAVRAGREAPNPGRTCYTVPWPDPGFADVAVTVHPPGSGRGEGHGSRAGIVLWQANAAGRYVHPSDISRAPLDPNFHGIASLKADSKGEWRIVTIKPGGYDSPIGHRPPHIHFDVRGQKHRNIAQLYFPEEAEGNARDSLYKMLGAEAATSVAVRNGGDPGKYTWDIILMG